MNKTFELEINDTPTSPPVERLQKLHHVLGSEIDEIFEVISSETQLDALVALADVLGDLVVYVFSEAQRWGIPLTEVLHIIMDSQDSKLIDGKPLKAPDNSKFIKGPNYVPPEPQIRALLHDRIRNSTP